MPIFVLNNPRWLRDPLLQTPGGRSAAQPVPSMIARAGDPWARLKRTWGFRENLHENTGVYIWDTVNIWYIAPKHKFLKSVLSFCIVYLHEHHWRPATQGFSSCHFPVDPSPGEASESIRQPFSVAKAPLFPVAPHRGAIDTTLPLQAGIYAGIIRWARHPACASVIGFMELLDLIIHYPLVN